MGFLTRKEKNYAQTTLEGFSVSEFVCVFSRLGTPKQKKGKKMKGYLFVFVFVLANVFFADTVLAAGGGSIEVPDIEVPEAPEYSNLGDYISLPGLSGSWSSSSYGDRASASVYMYLKEHQFESANWYFYVQEEDTSKWSASFTASGSLLEDGESSPLVPRNQSSRINRSGVILEDYLYLGPYYEYVYHGEKGEKGEKGEWEAIEKWFDLSGNFSLEPAVITSADFRYNEYLAEWMEPPETRWSIYYNVRGQFIADTVGEAQALGTQFVKPVPEPSTIVLLSILFGLGGGIIFLRYRRKC